VSLEVSAGTDGASYLSEVLATAAEGDERRIVEAMRGVFTLLPYAGVLRGARGVAETFEGNSLDTALLLHEVLADAGRTVRLARRSLHPAEAAWLLDFHVPMADLAQPVQSASPAVAEAAGTVERLAADVARAAAPSTAAERLSAEAEFARSLAVLRDHWWVQVRTGDRWQDLDPWQMAGEPTATLAPDRIDAADRHRVGLRLMIRSGRPQDLRTTVLAATELDAAALAGLPLYVTHEPLGPTFERAPATADAFIQALAEARAWLPRLVVGDTDHTTHFFTSDGRIRELTEANLDIYRPSSPSPMGGLMGGLLADLEDIGDGSTPDGGDRSVQRVWLEIDVTAPGGTPVRHVRELFAAPRDGTDPRDLAMALSTRSQFTVRTFALGWPTLARHRATQLRELARIAESPDPTPGAAERIFAIGNAVELDLYEALRFRLAGHEHDVFPTRPSVVADRKSVV